MFGQRECRRRGLRVPVCRHLSRWLLPLTGVVTGALPVQSLADRELAFSHVTIIDGRTQVPLHDRTVVIRGNRIVAVAAAGDVVVPSDARVVDGRGKFLVPGLWDMHVHTAVPGGADVLKLYVANGVTGVRDMAGDWALLTRWRDEIARAERVGPRMVVSGPYLEGGDVPVPHLTVKEPREARAAVDSLVQLGVDFIKVHGQLTRESYYAIARAARTRGIPFVGHVPRSVGAADASDSGQLSLEHLLTIPNSCGAGEQQALEPKYPLQSVFYRCATYDLAPYFARFVRNGTWIVPTLTAQVEVANWPVRDVPGDVFAPYLPDSLKNHVAEIFPMPPDVPTGADVVGRALFRKRVEIVGAMHRAGVRILPGTDAPLRNSPPGFGLHQELEYFIQAGFTPFEALRAATLEPASFLGIEDSLGTVQAGKIADLLLLDGDPLQDIRRLASPEVVVANGRAFRVRRDPRAHNIQLQPIR
ncbi:MAG: Adenine deaminase [Gemmatimonadaceae bacterium]|nr:Adenine deaminase [Gemmatimonadaceae bacterium]